MEVRDFNRKTDTQTKKTKKLKNLKNFFYKTNATINRPFYKLFNFKTDRKDGKNASNR